MFDNLTPLSADVIVIDPPWPFELYSQTGETKSAAAQYQTMSFDDIARLPVSQLARGDCLVLMWATEAIRPQAHAVMRAWGVTYKTAFVWRKVTKRGLVRMGTGYRVRSMHEPVLLGTIGNPAHAAFPSVFDGVAREHSRKPDEFYELVRGKTKNAVNRLDLFSRETRSGFIGWGNEATKFDDEVAA
ncbi:MT-A70 family methyltransferase [Tardiphaga sp.]|jgi:N6-adenosine-specific RNA methylase IME4|uniref:MT-A70 family methyltransferase n=1 Tax=Tardiphaga sp. TaxID=1926292 RepID=UPI0037DA4B7B